MLNRFRVFAPFAGIAVSGLLAGVLFADIPPAELPADDPVAAEADPAPTAGQRPEDGDTVVKPETSVPGDLSEDAEAVRPDSESPSIEGPLDDAPAPAASAPIMTQPEDPAATGVVGSGSDDGAPPDTVLGAPPSEAPQEEPSSSPLDAKGDDRDASDSHEDTPAPSDPRYDGEFPEHSGDFASGKLRFNFRFQPWVDVLEWFAREAGYSLLLDTPPSGTFNYTDNRDYTPAEALDLINSVLLTKGYTLVIRDRMLLVVNLEDEVPPALVTRIPVEDLDNHGKYELLSTRFQLRSLSAEQGRAEIEDLLGPQGDVVMLPQARQLIVTETGGKLREIRDVLERAEAVGDPSKQELKWFELKSVSPDEAAALLRQIFEIPEGGNATADGSMRMATDPIGLRLLISGTPERLEQVTKMLQTIDQPAFGEPAEAAQQAALQVEVYDIAPADPESVLRVTQTLLAESPGVRLAIDPKTGYLIALARPTEHATIRATIDQMRKDAQGVEVLQLRVLDPQIAVLAIGKLFGTDPQKAPSVDADLSNRQLLIRGSAGQIAEVRTLLKKMGETFGDSGGMAGGKLRLLPMDGESAEQLVDRLKVLWPALGSNELRFIRGDIPDGGKVQPRMIDERTPVPGPPKETPTPTFPGIRSSDQREPEPTKSGSGRKRVVRLAAMQVDDIPVERPRYVPDPAATFPDPPAREASTETAQTPRPVGEGVSAPVGKSPIFILSGPQGLVVSSEDIEALDRLQRLIDTLQGDSPSDSGEPKLTVFYLRHAQAQAVAERLTQLFAGAAPSATAGPAPAPGGRGEPAAPSGIMGTLGVAATVGRLTPSGPVSITPDSRLNALLVQAAPGDVDMVERVLEILDRPGSPEDVPAEPKPRLIPVVHMAASDVAEVIKEVYKDRLATGGTAARGGSPAEQMMAMFRGRRGDDRGQEGQVNAGAATAKDAPPKLSIGVDTRTNSLIVLAPEPLFEEVRELVASLDQVAADDVETVEVVRLSESNVESVRETLSTLLGDSIESSTSTRRGTTRTGDRGTNQRNTGRFPGGFGPFGGGGGFFGRGR